MLCEQQDDKPTTPIAMTKQSNGRLQTMGNGISTKETQRQRVNTMTLDRRAGTSKQLEESRKEIKTLQGQLIDAMNIVKKVKRQSEDTGQKKMQLEKEMERMKIELEQMQSKLSTSEEKTDLVERRVETQKCEIESLQRKSSSPPDSAQRGESPIATDDSLQELWLVQPQEIQLTQTELLQDNWSTVYIGSLRGLHVSARCFKEETLTDDNTKGYFKAIKASLKIRHPNIVQFIGATLSHNPIILTELMPTTLKMTLRQGSLPKRQVLSIASEIACALHYLHQQSIIHREVNTFSILLEPIGNSNWKAKLSECASSNFISYLKLISSSNQHFSIFAAPEAKAPELYSPKTDIYSFGVVLLEMCQPSEGIASASNDLRPRLQRLSWPMVVPIIRACICPAPSDRPTMFEVIQKLNTSGGRVSPATTTTTTNSESLV